MVITLFSFLGCFCFNISNIRSIVSFEYIIESGKFVELLHFSKKSFFKSSSKKSGSITLTSSPPKVFIAILIYSFISLFVRLDNICSSREKLYSLKNSFRSFHFSSILSQNLSNITCLSPLSSFFSSLFSSFSSFPFSFFSLKNFLLSSEIVLYSCIRLNKMLPALSL